jgi:TonB-dependent SusC/RagA subfamily outer membrane receptor
VIGENLSQPTLESIDPNDIESISVLKGESALEKYGDSGAFGVIEIRTKGKAGETKAPRKNQDAQENKQTGKSNSGNARVAPAEKPKEQSDAVTGKVIGVNQGPLIGATIRIKDTKIGTITDFEGNYSLELPGECATLLISYVGRKTVVVEKACRGEEIGIVLEEVVEATGTDPGRVTGPTPSGPARIDLQAYPNPSEGQVNIEFHLEKAARVQLGVYGIDGTLIQQLVDGELAAGPQKAIWQGSAPAKGVYLIQLQIDGAAFGTISRKVVLE